MVTVHLGPLSTTPLAQSLPGLLALSTVHPVGGTLTLDSQRLPPRRSARAGTRSAHTSSAKVSERTASAVDACTFADRLRCSMAGATMRARARALLIADQVERLLSQVRGTVSSRCHRESPTTLPTAQASFLLRGAKVTEEASSGPRLVSQIAPRVTALPATFSGFPRSPFPGRPETPTRPVRYPGPRTREEDATRHRVLLEWAISLRPRRPSDDRT